MAKLGLHTFAIAPQWNVDRIEAYAERLSAFRVRALEIPLLDPSEIDIGATRRLCERIGMEPVCSLGLPADIDVITDPDAGLAFLEPAFEVAGGIGASSLSGVTYGTIGRTTGEPRSTAEYDGTARFLARAAAQARDHGLSLGIEPCNRYETHIMNTGADARRFCEAVGAENLFIHLDTYHMNIEERSFHEGFASCGDFLGYVHLSESNRGAPGAGTIDWAAVFAALAQLGFGGITTLESMNFVHPNIASALAIWRPVAANPQDVIDVGLASLHAAAETAGFRYD